MNRHTETDSVESLLPALIKMRDNALGVNFDAEAAVLLSHTIGWMMWIKTNRSLLYASQDLLEACRGLVADRETLEQDEGITVCQCPPETPDQIVAPPPCEYCMAMEAIRKAEKKC